jgi:SpoVK/Ycf46/Vps4 family AAA+-type ATPase
VTWERTAFDVIVFEWGDSMLSRVARSYVVAPDRARGEAFFAALAHWRTEVRSEILVFSDGGFTKSDKLFRAVQHASFDQLVLGDDLARQIRDDFRNFLASADVYADAGVPWRRGALFVGPPGNGKTLCVKALVRELAVPCIYVQSFEVPYGTAKGAIDVVFKRAREQAPCVLVLEDIDALLVPGSTSFFLNELDGFASNAGVITIATTNHPERLDPSILERPSRFDRTYHFGLPAEATRRAYAALWNERLRPALRLDAAAIAEVARLTDGFSFAYIQEMFVSSTMQWMQSREDGGIRRIAVEQIRLLREQMSRA